jgi:hypothetical protein
MQRLWVMLLSQLAPARLAPERPRPILTLEEEQKRMRQRLEDQERRLRGLKTELQLIRHDVDALRQEDKE